MKVLGNLFTNSYKQPEPKQVPLNDEPREEEESALPQYHGQQKRRHRLLFCGCLDTRAATVILNFIHILFSVLLEVLEWIRVRGIEEPPVLCLLAAINSGLAIFGAMNFSIVAIVISFLGHLFLFYLYFTETHVFGMVFLCLTMSAQVAFGRELRRGIMSKETYADVEYIMEEGREVIVSAHSFASEISETATNFVHQVRQHSSQNIAEAITLKKASTSRLKGPETEEC
mmetsp:Transcript_14651/g.23754  ORF Transcript_14651/g.23754 Transcript_14651/m.23754 type:complete len:229 (+) Transcript_14651:34-720(+)|eukprot:CAMPEP_0178761952 /NCGR_PEP_ID=MMETSP0744-20121128/16281_1 /TAXON_ID=913974 /ORGANISM="Nitzschia punctata, Strain CCMP561" /LENGTH=228 /DNA_ID=CAMNT_0020416593 /DNA_START=48 /DNA_END=734 /DNA_ORIENTATION=-